LILWPQFGQGIGSDCSSKTDFMLYAST